jgi:ATP-dependent DNA helicase DinG
MIDEVFGPGGLFAQKFAGYAPRSGQIELARAVRRAITEQQHLIAEGPTGTGKGLAYLVPAIEHSTGTRTSTNRVTGRPETRHGGKTIVVTANIALQEQLVTKDLPLLRDVLDRPFRFALIKGKNNYLCIDAVGKMLAEGLLRRDDELDRLLAWAQSTETGDVSEFPEQPSAAVWRRMSVGSDECKGQQCKYFGQCFAEKAKDAMHEADVVVTNYHMFFAHLVVRSKMRQIAARGGAVDPDIVLPPADVVVFDEAHKAADIARDFLGFTFSKGAVDWLLRGFNHDVSTRCKQESEQFFRKLCDLKASRSYRSRLKRGHGLEGEPLALCLDAVAKFYAESVNGGAWDEDERAELLMRSRRSASLASNLREAMKPEMTDRTVYFIEETRGRGGAVSCAIKSKPIDVGAWLKEELFGQYRSVILTSATLATGGGSKPFDFVRKEVGLETGEDLVAESPFSWSDSAMLVIPKTTADPKDRDAFPPSVAEHVRDVAKASKGRTLALFTSYKNLELAADACRGLPYRVLKQGQAPRTKLVEDFKKDVSSVLLGCESFWAGVDVPGEALSCVVIDRLPFPTPDDPIVDAIAERDKNWFFTYAVPRAIIQVKQGAGRLIRSVTDRGCIVILDQRVVKMGYGRALLAALPKMKMADEVEDVAAFFAKEAGR